MIRHDGPMSRLDRIVIAALGFVLAATLMLVTAYAGAILRALTID